MAGATDEIKIRMTPEQKAALQDAAALEGTTVSEFVRSAAGAHANQLLTSARLRQVTSLPQESFDALVAALVEPGVPSEALVAAADRLVAIDLD